MKTDPLKGDITALRGEYDGLYRRRIGSWRIIFGLKPDRRAVLVGDISAGLQGRTEGVRRTPVGSRMQRVPRAAGQD
jgi:hypothetical protein